MRFPPNIPAGIVSDDTSHTAAGRWLNSSNMRFRLGRPETIGGWESVIANTLGGVCRTIFPWSDNDAILNIAFGTHATLEVYQGGELFNITPTLAMPAATLTAPFTVTDASAVVTVSHPNHGLTTDDDIIVSGASSVGRITPSGTYNVTVTGADSYTFTHGSPADLAETLGNNPLTTTNLSPVVTVADTAHGIPDGTIVTFSGATAVGGITPNGAFPITVTGPDAYTFTFTSSATSGATGGGNAVVATVPGTGGGSVVITPQVAFAAGQIDGTGSAGFGTGGYGVGGYGEPSTTDYFPRTWSFGAYGETLMASPRGGTIFQWLNNTAADAAPLANAPRQVSYMLVASQDMVFALGCNEEVSGAFNPLCIRHSGVRAATTWNTGSNTTAREYILPGGGRIVSGRVMGPYVLVWTTSSLFLGQFLGSLEQPWRFDRVGDHCGLAGPNAAVVVGQTAYWVSPDRQFYSYTLGGAPSIVRCPIRSAYAENLAPSQADKIVASSVAEFGEVWWHYPDARDGLENSRYVAVCVDGEDAGAWFPGLMARTASVDAGPSSYPCRTTYDGAIYWHERGHSADGAALQYFIETADQMMDEERSMLIRQIRPDFQGQEGPVSITLTTRFEPQGSETVRGPYSAAPGARKVDARATGRFVKIRYAGDSTPAWARLGQTAFDVTPAGRR